MIAEKHLRTLPASKNSQRVRLQDLWDQSELTKIKHELGLPTNKSFEKVVLALFYDRGRDKLVGMAANSANRFKEVYTYLDL